MKVAVYETYWVPGARAIAYFGQISAESYSPDFDTAVAETVEALCVQARGCGANAIVSLRVDCDPFGGQLSVESMGTVVKVMEESTL